MDNRTHYRRAAVQSLSLVLLFLIMAAPQLMSVRPTGVFAEFRNVLERTPLTTWLIVGVGALIALVVISFARQVRRPAKASEGATTRPSIEDAVLPQNKGNGLASATFPLNLPWFGIAGWVHVEEGKECVVIDGRQVVHRSRICFTPLRLIGKPIYARRVLLQPPTLNDLSEKALSADRLELTLVTTVKYNVTDPIYVATQQTPLTQLSELIKGAIAEYIRSDTLENLVGDNEGAIRRKLKVQLEHSTSIRGYYAVTEVLKALPTGDQRIIEIIRKIREESSRTGLIDIEAINKQKIAEPDLRIEREKRELEDFYKGRDTDRELQMLHVQNQARTLQEVMIMVGQIAGAGVNPKGALEEIRHLLQSTSTTSAMDTPRLVVTKEDLLAEEQQMLERHKVALGITAVLISPHSEKQTAPGQAQIVFPDFVLSIDCSKEYPSHAPNAQIQLRNGGRIDLVMPWEEGNRLLYVATTAKMRVQTETEIHSDQNASH